MACWLSAFYYQVLAQGFTQSLLLDDAGSVLATATSWDELEIQEEAESGSSVTSTIRLPIQVSGCPGESACGMDWAKQPTLQRGRRQENQPTHSFLAEPEVVLVTFCHDCGRSQLMIISCVAWALLIGELLAPK